MWQGRIVERGPVVRVLTEPQHQHTRQLLADADLTLEVPADGVVGGPA
jgi:ABC-type microcin C transport system duplicated ATPase subunit YejF